MDGPSTSRQAYINMLSHMDKSSYNSRKTDAAKNIKTSLSYTTTVKKQSLINLNKASSYSKVELKKNILPIREVKKCASKFNNLKEEIQESKNPSQSKATKATGAIPKRKSNASKTRSKVTTANTKYGNSKKIVTEKPELPDNFNDLDLRERIMILRSICDYEYGTSLSENNSDYWKISKTKGAKKK